MKWFLNEDEQEEYTEKDGNMFNEALATYVLAFRCYR